MLKLELPAVYLSTLKQLIKTYAADAEVWAYGSRVSGEAHEASDLDLVLRNPAALNQCQKRQFALTEAIAESNLPILVDVLDWARLPETFHAEIEKNYVVVWPVRES